MNVYKNPQNLSLKEWHLGFLNEQYKLQDLEETFKKSLLETADIVIGQNEGIKIMSGGEALLFMNKEAVFFIKQTSSFECEKEYQTPLESLDLGDEAVSVLPLTGQPSPEMSPLPEQNLLSKPYLKLLSPKGGEKWIAGGSYNVLWESGGIDKVDVYFYWDSGTVGGGFPIQENLQANLGKTTLSIPSYFPPYDSYYLCLKELPEWVKLSDKVSAPKERYYPSACTNLFNISWKNRPVPFIDIVFPGQGAQLAENNT